MYNKYDYEIQDKLEKIKKLISKAERQLMNPNCDNASQFKSYIATLKK
jgi:hypothetical protein